MWAPAEREFWTGGSGSVLLALLLVGAVSCSETDREGTASESVPKSANVEIVDRFDKNLTRNIAAEARRRAESASVATLLEGEGSDAEGEPAVELQRRQLLNEVYGGRDYELVWFVDRSGALEPAEHTRTLREMLAEGVEAHGLWPEQMHLERIRTIGEESADVEASWTEASLSEEDRDKLLTYLSDQGLDLDVADDMERLAEIVADPEGPLPRFAERTEKAAGKIEGEIREVAKQELLLTDALAEYLVEMRYGNPVWHEPRSWRATLRLGERGPLRSTSLAGNEFDETPASIVQRAVERARTRTFTVEEVREIFSEPASVGESMRSAHPPFRQYGRLTEAFEQYREYVENGGWPEIPAAAEGLQRGSYSPHVPTLKERLWIEGYWEPPEDSAGDGGSDGSAGDEAELDSEKTRYFTERFDETLEDALTEYQKTHQFYPKGKLRGPTLSSLNVSARERWNQIRVTLERWRESRVGADDHYVHVNVADFHAEVWRDGERQMRFRIITGSSKRKKNEETDEFVYTRATPTFSDEIEYIVFNPYWNVPESIRENELKPKLLKDPSYFERHNYEIVTDEHGNRFVRQKPGPENALGKVKFLFPNEHSVYMHDTPERFLFNKPTRGYSHGCIRIEDPMEFASYLLDLDGRWTGRAQDKQIEEWSKEKEEHWVTLKQTLPVHIEYYVVRVGDEGRTHFLADIYDRDEPRLERVEERLEQYPDSYDLPEREVDELMAAALAGELD